MLLRQKIRLAGVLLCAGAALTLWPIAARAQAVATFASGLGSARGLAVDQSGNLYVSRRYPVGTITRFSPPSTTPTVVATGLVEPIDMVFGDDGNLYCTDYVSSGRLWQITPGGTKTAFATFSYPGALTRDAAGNFYVGEYYSGKVFKVSPAGASTLYANMPVSTGDRLTALYVSPSGKLFCGSLDGYIYLIGPSGGSMSPFSSGLGSVLGLVAGEDDVLFAATYGSHRIRMVDTSGTHSVLAGTGTAGLLNGPPLSARFNLPAGIVLLNGKIYVAEYGNGDIRELDGLGAVAIERESFGGVKAMFR